MKSSKKVKAKKALLPSPGVRGVILNERRNGKIAASPHAYVRGSIVQLYKWLAEGGERVAPKGPPIWICGDCHVRKLGPLADARGQIHIQMITKWTQLLQLRPERQNYPLREFLK